jgi:hypothetical protein
MGYDLATGKTRSPRQQECSAVEVRAQIYLDRVLDDVRSMCPSDEQQHENVDDSPDASRVFRDWPMRRPTAGRWISG